MWLDPRFGSTTVVDPMDWKHSVTFSGCPKHRWLAHTHLELARRYQFSILEVYDMAQLVAGLAIFGEAGAEGYGPIIEEVKGLVVETKWDADRLSAEPPLHEVGNPRA
jgi:hypothetical protein